MIQSTRDSIIWREDFTSGNDVKIFTFATTKMSDGNDIQFPAKNFRCFNTI